MSVEQLLDYKAADGMTNRDRLVASSPLKTRPFSANLIFPGQQLVLPK
jgi:hypothetical protein